MYFSKALILTIALATLGLMFACGGGSDDNGCGNICDKFRECNVVFEYGYTNDACENVCENAFKGGGTPKAAWECKIDNCSNSTCDALSACTSDTSVQSCIYGN